VHNRKTKMDENLVGKKVSIDYGPSSTILHVEILEVHSSHIVVLDASGRTRYIPLTSINIITVSSRSQAL
jgi:ferredoxin-fold anticodon binding domain-containing protein